MKKALWSFVFLVVATLSVVAQTVYKTPSGKKYHLQSCRMVENVSERLLAAEAAAKGLTPCKICKPDVAAKSTPLLSKAKGKDVTVQCQGLTKKGNRCRHMTSIADGFCYQHKQ